MALKGQLWALTIATQHCSTIAALGTQWTTLTY
jgi:hypothetical protein